MSVAKVRAHTNAIISALEGMGLAAGRAEAPQFVDPPYVAVYPIPGGIATGVLDDVDGDAELIYQFTCVGKTAEQAEWAADVALGILGVSNPITVPNRHVNMIRLEMFPGVTRDDEVSPPRFYSSPRVRVYSTPA